MPRSKTMKVRVTFNVEIDDYKRLALAWHNDGEPEKWRRRRARRAEIQEWYKGNAPWHDDDLVYEYQKWAGDAPWEGDDDENDAEGDEEE